MADQIRYDLLTQQALRGVVRSVLADAAKKGLLGDHHFFIEFDTLAAGVRMSDRLRAQHPEKMTIILQLQFWDLTVNDTVFEVGLILADGSNCHAAALDPQTRAVTGLFSLQGFNNDTVWARGQGWAMLGYAHGYEASGNPVYLDAARRAADWYVEHVPPGWVPHYDFHDPDRDSLPYCSCTAAIAAAQLMRLAQWLPDRAERYRTVARETLRALLTNFFTPGGVVLHGSWGRMRHVEPGKPRLGRFPQEDVMPYGNYWIAECLYRALSPDWSVLSLTAAA